VNRGLKGSRGGKRRNENERGREHRGDITQMKTYIHTKVSVEARGKGRADGDVRKSATVMKDREEQQVIGLILGDVASE